MVHGGSRSARIGDVESWEASEPLEWKTIGAWRYALGDFGTIQGYCGLSPWVVRVHGHRAVVYRTLEEARRALERAALDLRYEIVE